MDKEELRQIFLDAHFDAWNDHMKPYINERFKSIEEELKGLRLDYSTLTKLIEHEHLKARVIDLEKRLEKAGL